MWFVTTFSHPLWQKLGLSLLHFLWQGAAVAALVALALVLLRPRPSRPRYALFLAALVTLAACPLVTFFSVEPPPRPAIAGGRAGQQADGLMLTDQPGPRSGPLNSSGEVFDAGAAPVAEPAGEVATAAPRSWWSKILPDVSKYQQYLPSAIPWFVAFWLLGVLWLSVRLCVGLAAMRGLQQRLTALPDHLSARVGRIAERLGLAGFKSVFLSDSAADAMLTGFLKPMVLIPAAMLTQLSPEMIEAIIAHELAHLRRLDLWVNLFQNVVEALLFYHPAVWWISARVRRERELCCDELAAATVGSTVTYASALEAAGRLRLASPSPTLVPALGLRPLTLLDRVRHVLGVSPARAKGSRWPAGLVTLAVLLVVGLAVQWALTMEARRATAAPAATVWAAEAGLGDASATEQQILLQEAALPPEKAVVIETRRPWHQSGWMREFYQLAECLTVDPEPGYGRIIINEPQGYQALVRYFALPVDQNRYPILVLNYRATNAHMSNCQVWLDDGTGPDFGGIVAVTGSEMVSDGRIHEVRKDLRTLNPKGPFCGMTLFLQCADHDQMTFDLIGLRFEAAPDAPPAAPLLRGAPARIRVVDQQGRPVPGATVTVDPERRNFAMIGQTDGYGQVSVAPLQTESGGHALRVEGPGYMAADLKSWSSPADGSPFTVTLVRAVSYGGTMVDEKSQPVAGAGVKLYISNSRTGCEVLTDAAGRWQTPPLPADATELYSLRVNHPEYLPKRLGTIYSEAGPGTEPPTLAQLREQRAVIIVENANAITGRVVDSLGQPVANARVAVTGPCVAVPGYSNVQKWYTDVAGNFRLSPLKAAEATVIARSKLFAPVVIKTAAGPAAAPLEFRLDAGEEMSVRLVDDQGRPVTKALAYLEDWDGIGDWMFLAVVLGPDADGRIIWKHAPRGRLTFDLKTPDFLNEFGSPHTFTVTVPASEEQQIILTRKGSAAN